MQQNLVKLSLVHIITMLQIWFMNYSRFFKSSLSCKDSFLPIYPILSYRPNLTQFDPIWSNSWIILVFFKRVRWVAKICFYQFIQLTQSDPIWPNLTQSDSILGIPLLLVSEQRAAPLPQHSAKKWKTAQLPVWLLPVPVLPPDVVTPPAKPDLPGSKLGGLGSNPTATCWLRPLWLVLLNLQRLWEIWLVLLHLGRYYFSQCSWLISRRKKNIQTY